MQHSTAQLTPPPPAGPTRWAAPAAHTRRARASAWTRPRQPRRRERLEKEVGGHAPLDGAAAIRVHVTSNLAWIKNLSLLGD